MGVYKVAAISCYHESQEKIQKSGGKKKKGFNGLLDMRSPLSTCRRALRGADPTEEAEEAA